MSAIAIRVYRIFWEFSCIASICFYRIISPQELWGFVCVVLGVGVISVFDAVAFLACMHRVSSAHRFLLPCTFLQSFCQLLPLLVPCESNSLGMAFASDSILACTMPCRVHSALNGLSHSCRTFSAFASTHEGSTTVGEVTGVSIVGVNLAFSFILKLVLSSWSGTSYIHTLGVTHPVWGPLIPGGRGLLHGVG